MAVSASECDASAAIADEPVITAAQERLATIPGTRSLRRAESWSPSVGETAVRIAIGEQTPRRAEAHRDAVQLRKGYANIDSGLDRPRSWRGPLRSPIDQSNVESDGQGQPIKSREAPSTAREQIRHDTAES